MVSCGDGYTSSPAKREYIDSINDSIAAGQQNKETWAQTPEAIAGHFFPYISHTEGGNKRYQIITQPISAKECILTVINEGPIDDEIIGEHHEVNFQIHEGRWKIMDLVNSYKRRD